MVIPLSILVECKTIQRKDVEKIENQNSHFIFNTFLPKILPFVRKIEKYHTAGQATDDNIVPAHCTLDT